MKGLLPDGLNTYVGIIAAFAPTVLSWFGYAPTPEFNEQLQPTIMALVTLAGVAYAFYGKARHQIPTWFKKA